MVYGGVDSGVLFITLIINYSLNKEHRDITLLLKYGYMQNVLIVFFQLS